MGSKVNRILVVVVDLTSWRRWEIVQRSHNEKFFYVVQKCGNPQISLCSSMSSEPQILWASENILLDMLHTRFGFVREFGLCISPIKDVGSVHDFDWLFPLWGILFFFLDGDYLKSPKLIFTRNWCIKISVSCWVEIFAQTQNKREALWKQSGPSVQDCRTESSPTIDMRQKQETYLKGQYQKWVLVHGCWLFLKHIKDS